MAQTTTVTIGDRQFTIGKITLGAIRRNPDAFAVLAPGIKTGSIPTKEQFAAMVYIAREAIVEPKLPDTEFEKLLDSLEYDVGVEQLAEAVQLAMVGSGFVKAEDGATGEQAPVAAGSSPLPASATSTA